MRLFLITLILMTHEIYECTTICFKLKYAYIVGYHYSKLFLIQIMNKFKPNNFMTKMTLCFIADNNYIHDFLFVRQIMNSNKQ